METSERDALRERVMAAIDEHAAEITGVAQQIHDRPELGYEERFASGLLVEALRRHGMEVEAPVGGVETAFRAVKHGGAGQSEGPTVAVLAEYDALAGIGHGCAHNLIAASGLAAAIALAPLMDQLPGTFEVIGTPAEEGGGGKIRLIDAGIFEGVDASVMVHHAGDRTLAPQEYPGGTCLAITQLNFAFHGQPAHSAGDPWKGANALNGVIQLFNGIDALRQHVKPEARIHGIIRHGGDATNVVPHRASASFGIRAGSREYLETLVEQVRRIAEGAALMTGTTVEITQPEATYLDERPSYVIGRRYTENMRAAGMEISAEKKERGSYSTDFGNVSYLIPAATGSFAISHEAIPGHSQAVVEAACSGYGMQQMLKVSKALALTALDLLTDPEMLAAAKDEHAHWTERYERSS
ncbi:MAG TPA: M20 family metallopeptidase [Ktedonobacterales bacterium]|nr:M20 family metallopeptidase [Ktedonobacterales bacterium]